MEERRSARVGTVSGLAVLAGGTAVAAVAGGAHSVFATILLALLAFGMGHSLLVEIRRQAHRRSAGGWSRHDTINAVTLGALAEAALIMTIEEAGYAPLQVVGLALAVAYAGSCGHFVTERRRTVQRSAASGANPREPQSAAPVPENTAIPPLASARERTKVPATTPVPDPPERPQG